MAESRSPGAGALWAISSVPFIMVLGNSMLIPILPTMQSVLGISQFQASLVVTLFSVPAGLIIPLAGFLSDRLKRKWIIIPSLGLYALGGLVAAIGAWMGQRVFLIILIGRVIQGFGAAGTAPIAMALVSDLFQGGERSRALGLNEVSNGLGKVVSPILGAWVGSLLWYGAFLLFPILTIPVMIGLWLAVKEPPLRKGMSATRYWQSFVTIWKRDAHWLLVGYFSGATALFLLFGVLFYVSETLEAVYHLGVFARGTILAVPLTGMCTASYLTGRWIKKNRPLMKGAVVGGLGVVAGTLFLLPFLRSPGWQLGDLVLSGIGTGVVLPSLNTLITGTAEREERGIITSFYGSVRFLGVAAGPPVFSQLMKLPPIWMFGLCAGLAAVAGGLALWFIRVSGHPPSRRNTPFPRPWGTAQKQRA
ncbi:MAG TPA: MFS transporter [Alicyclobacillus sp.]|nr:MFS transporter [Alicyclobacillus sp.]